MNNENLEFTTINMQDYGKTLSNCLQKCCNIYPEEWAEMEIAKQAYEAEKEKNREEWMEARRQVTHAEAMLSQAKVTLIRAEEELRQADKAAADRYSEKVRELYKQIQDHGRPRANQIVDTVLTRMKADGLVLLDDYKNVQKAYEIAEKNKLQRQLIDQLQQEKKDLKKQITVLKHDNAVKAVAVKKYLKG